MTYMWYVAYQYVVYMNHCLVAGTGVEPVTRGYEPFGIPFPHNPRSISCSLQSKVALFADRVQCRKALGERLLPFFKYRQESMGHPFRSLWSYGLFKPQYILLPALGLRPYYRLVQPHVTPE